MNKQQRGATLIELMISMVLSLGLIAGISSLFLQMQKSNKIQNALGSMADESSYVQEVLQKEIRRTGGLRERSDRNGSRDKVFLGTPVDNAHQNMLGSVVDYWQGQYILGDPGSPANDELVIRYQLLDDQDLGGADPSNGNSPCTQHVLLDAGEDPATTVHVVTVAFKLNGGLICSAQRETVDVTAGASGVASCVKNCTSATNFTPDANIATVSLVSNVAKLAVSYGIDSDATADNAANYYVPANTVATLVFPGVTAGNAWQRVVSVRLSLVMQSAEDHLTDTIVPYEFNGATITPTDHRLYRVFTTTIALRNILL
jgi:Tfp pilus assembly protein PilW